ELDIAFVGAGGFDDLVEQVGISGLDIRNQKRQINLNRSVFVRCSSAVGRDRCVVHICNGDGESFFTAFILAAVLCATIVFQRNRDGGLPILIGRRGKGEYSRGADGRLAAEQTVVIVGNVEAQRLIVLISRPGADVRRPRLAVST